MLIGTDYLLLIFLILLISYFIIYILFLRRRNLKNALNNIFSDWEADFRPINSLVIGKNKMFDVLLREKNEVFIYWELTGTLRVDYLCILSFEDRQQLQTGVYADRGILWNIAKYGVKHCEVYSTKELNLQDKQRFSSFVGAEIHDGRVYYYFEVSSYLGQKGIEDAFSFFNLTREGEKKSSNK